MALHTHGFTLPEVLIALVVVAFMIPGVLSYQANVLAMMGKARARVELATGARTLIAQHFFDEKKTRSEMGGDILIYAEQSIQKDSPLSKYEGLKIATVAAETTRLPQKMLFATLIREEKKDEARV